MSSEKKLRRKYLVDSSYQLSQVAITIGANISVALLMAALLSWFYLLVWNGTVVCNHNKMIPVYIGCIAIMIILLSSLWSMRRSRIIAGVLKKLDIILTQAGHGTFNELPLTFRKGDYFASLAAPLNSLLNQLREKEYTRSKLIQSLENLKGQISSKNMSNEDVDLSLAEIISTLKKGETGNRGEAAN